MSLIDENDNSEFAEQKEFDRLQLELDDCWSDIVDELTNDVQFKGMERPLDWLRVVLNVNVPQGKKFRGFACLKMYRELTKNSKVTPEEDKVVKIISWCIEILQTAALIADDMMDQSRTRRGKPCWYLVDGVGPAAVNDVLLLESAVNRLLDRHITKPSHFMAINKLLHETTMRTLLGECLDTKMGQDEVDLERFTFDTYKAVVEYKTSYYTFYAPVAFAMIMAGRTKEEEFNIVKKILLQIGYLFQIQDDFLDCYGDPQVTGKIGTDIEEGKCTWLVVQAKELASPSQLQVLQEVYGDPEQAHVVKKIYAELRIAQHFNKVEDNLYNEISETIEKLPLTNMKDSMYHILNSIYRRDH